MQALRQPAVAQRTLGSRSSSLCSALHLTGLRQARQPAALCADPAARPAPLQLQQLKQHQQHRCSHVARVTPWGTQVDGQSLASQLFAASLFPYLAFLYYLTKSGKTPRLVLGGFYFLLAFVGATIPAGIYAKTHYGTSLANVDWLHGSAESLLTVTNLMIVLGLRQGIREAEAKNATDAAAAAKEAEEAGLGTPAGNGTGAKAGAGVAANAASRSDGQ
ncbi:hypothetical protein COO60DRAFT_1294946 [Scenedesmus sp. NREL 46B-D3]|nr:hypothetical protein COO60DRAFT_1294946 [Scenedesmus sp. NREL 46B-D3]